MAGFKVALDREVDGRWIAEIPDLPDVIVYGRTADEARIKVLALATRITADNERSRRPQA
jgi:predicted RNase H-like HicB family nuclease